MIKLYIKREKTVIGMTSIEEKKGGVTVSVKMGGGGCRSPFPYLQNL